MVLSPFHLLKERITVDANVSVSFITVIIQPVKSSNAARTMKIAKITPKKPPIPIKAHFSGLGKPEDFRWGGGG